MNPLVVAPITLEDAPGFHAALDVVARERMYLALNEAPPLEKTIAFVAKNIHEGHVHLVARDGSRVVGWCDILPRGEHPATGMVGMGLLADYRGRGAGTKLLRDAIDAANRHGRFSRIQLNVRKNNAGAIALYKKLGFEIVADFEREAPGHEAELYVMVLK